VTIKAFGIETLYARLAKPGEPFDLAYEGWIGAPDPDVLNFLVESGQTAPALDDPAFRKRLTEAARLTGVARYQAYAELDNDLAREAAPLVAIGNLANHDFFSARVGCQSFGPYGIDFSALCLR
jgi:hypothetical protein